MTKAATNLNIFSSKLVKYPLEKLVKRPRLSSIKRPNIRMRFKPNGNAGNESQNEWSANICKFMFYIFFVLMLSNIITDLV